MRFHTFFGAPAIAVLDAWHKLIFHAFLPKGGWFFHLHWAFKFMDLCSPGPDMFVNDGSSCHAIDPKTFMKWAWPSIEASVELKYIVEYFVVYCSLFLLVILSCLLCRSFYLKTNLSMITAFID
jgi:hypothetical protein